MLPQANSAFSRYCIKLLDKRLSGQLSEEEFDRKIAYTAMNPISFVELVAHDKPELPKELMDAGYYHLTDDQKNKLDWNHPVLNKYLKDVHQADAQNVSNRKWLEWVQSKIPAHETDLHMQLRERINELNGTKTRAFAGYDLERSR